MQFLSLALLGSLAAALPSPAIQTPKAGEKFGLITIRSGSALQYLPIIASKSILLAGGTQDASCKPPGSSSATFYVKDGQLFLYGSKGEEVQQMWVDRSGMGQGISGYTTGNQSAPRNSERKGFAVDKNGHLVFDGISPQACPSTAEGTGPYSLWFSTAAKPGFHEGCLGVALRAIKADDPVSCVYTSS